MTKSGTLHIRIEPNVKKQAEETLNELGLSITDAVNVFLKQVILTESIPFAIKKPKLNKETIQAIEDAEKGVNLSKGYNNLNAMWKDLEKED